MFANRLAYFSPMFLLFAPTLLLAAASNAVTADDTPSITVRYYDLNLDNTAGIASLYRRIHDAAADVCRASEAPELINRAGWNVRKECVAHAVANAVKSVHNEKLNAYHWQRIRPRNVLAKNAQQS